MTKNISKLRKNNKNFINFTSVQQAYKPKRELLTIVNKKQARNPSCLDFKSIP